VMRQLVSTPDLQLYLDQVPKDWPQDAFLLSDLEMAYCLQSRQLELQLSRAKLRLMVKQIFNNPQIEVVSGKLGRPLAHPDWDISFSHKDQRALVGLVRTPDKLGVDLESLRQKIDWSAFFGHCFLDQEAGEILKLARISGWDGHSANLGFFSLKEAFFKALNMPFTPADLRLVVKAIENDAVFFEVFHKGQKQMDVTCNILKTTDEVISVCHLRASI